MTAFHSIEKRKQIITTGTNCTVDTQCTALYIRVCVRCWLWLAMALALRTGIIYLLQVIKRKCVFFFFPHFILCRFKISRRLCGRFIHATNSSRSNERRVNERTYERLKKKITIEVPRREKKNNITKQNLVRQHAATIATI